MGNFLFQAACAAAYAWQHKLEFTVPNSTNSPKWNPIYLQHLVDPKWNSGLPEILIQEGKHFNFRLLPFEEGWRDKNIVLDGYWQTERYFRQYRRQLLEAFNFPWMSLREWVSVHVRRGDYLTIQKDGVYKHPPVSKEWILEQMAKFPGSLFKFFSDDIGWCKKEFGSRPDVAFAQGENEVDDLTQMSWCENHICSASTFSWWGAYLNQNPYKRVIMPKHWLSPGWGGLDTSDIVPKEWERA